MAIQEITKYYYGFVIHLSSSSMHVGLIGTLLVGLNSDPLLTMNR